MILEHKELILSIVINILQKWYKKYVIKINIIQEIVSIQLNNQCKTQQKLMMLLLKDLEI